MQLKNRLGVLVDVPDTAITNIDGITIIGNLYRDADKTWNEVYLQGVLDVNKMALDLNANKQNVLVSGVNIKTINNESILGNGNIEITGGNIDPLILDTKQDKLVSGTNIKTINGNPVLGAGDIAITAANLPGLEAKMGIEIVTSLPTTAPQNKVVFNITTNKFHKYISGAWTTVSEPISFTNQIAEGSITTKMFASGIRPYEIVDSLPIENNFNGRICYLTSDSKIYRYSDAYGWICNIAASDITGTMASDLLPLNSIGVSHIKNNSITADKIADGSVTTLKIANESIVAAHLTIDSINTKHLRDNSVTSTKIVAGSITSSKLAANAVTGDKITNKSITAEKIADNSITSAMLQTGIVNTAHIMDNSISLAKIQNNAIDATKIANNSITSTMLQASAIKDIAAKFNSARGTVSTLIGDTPRTAIVAADGGINAYAGVIGNGQFHGVVGEAFTAAGYSVYGYGNTSNNIGVCGESVTNWGVYGKSGTGTAVYGLTNSSTNAAVKGVSTNVASGVYGMSQAGYGIEGYSQLGLYAIGTSQKIYANNGYSPFTGSHHVYMDATDLKIGDLIRVKRAVGINVSQVFVEGAITNKEKDVAVYGVCASISKEKMLPRSEELYDIDKEVKVLNNGGIYENINSKKVKPEFKELLTFVAAESIAEVEVNALGEGMLNVCGLGGDINTGDYLCSSNLPGAAMKQDDDLLHNYTVAKALESITFKDKNEVKQICVTYHCS